MTTKGLLFTSSKIKGFTGDVIKGQGTREGLETVGQKFSPYTNEKRTGSLC